MKVTGPYCLYDIIQVKGKVKFETTAIHFDINKQLNHTLKRTISPLKDRTIDTCKELNDKEVKSLSLAINQVKKYIKENEAGSKRMNQLDYLVNTYEHFRNWHNKYNLPSESAEEYVFKHIGATWVVRYNGIEKTIKHTKGMGYIAFLLRHQGQSFHSMQMFQIMSGIIPNVDERRNKISGKRTLKDEGLQVRNEKRIELLDKEALVTLMHTIKQLENERNQAMEENDSRRIDTISFQIEKINDYLSKYTYKGRIRTASDATARMRQSIFKAINTAKKNIKKYHKELFEHLDKFLTTGTYNSYSPDTPVPWVQNQ